MKEKDGKAAETRRVHLRKGERRGLPRYCVGYPPFRAGLVLSGAPEKLWT